MKIRGNLLRVLFGVNLLLFVFSILSPWAWKTRSSLFERPPWPFFSGEEWYWSFQAVLYNPRPGYKIMMIEWDFWFRPQERAVLWDFWFSREMYYYGFTYEWIRIFAFQLLTAFSGFSVLVGKWHKTKLMLVPFSFSTLSVLTGLLLVARFMFVWHGYANPAWGLPVAILSTLVFLVLFFIRYGFERKKPKAD